MILFEKQNTYKEWKYNHSYNLVEMFVLTIQIAGLHISYPSLRILVFLALYQIRLDNHSNT